MPRLGDYEVWIEMDDARLVEYAIECDIEEREIHCWTASKEGKNFIIHLKDHTPTRETRWDIKLDGKSGGGRLTCPEMLYSTVVGCHTTTTTTQLYQFGKLRFTDDEQLGAVDEAFLQQMGTVKVAAVDGTITGPRPMGDIRDPAAFLAPRPVYEKLKKAASHCIVPGVTAEKVHSFVEFVPQGKDTTIFVFLYGPKALLCANKIILPDTPSDSVRRDCTRRDEGNHGHRLESEQGEKCEADKEKVKEARIRQIQEELAALRASRRGKEKSVHIKGEGDSRHQRIKKEETNEELAALRSRMNGKRNTRSLKDEDEGRTSLKRIKTEAVTFKPCFAPGEIIDLT
ncbi:hypothetical protein CALCODRAFT_517318 [Calocera cornea HHB12733]|uniref:Uncharacterized protein n=1 Tax=Calocera cornea HHB12733 TaxID=1353952 RepID=A0A165G6J6_9BASI|nr:hypothetical protein CALCODRAFT_517318 [Calocera cornea HHB12733]